ncbi:MAG: sulfatase [Akkermansiaceae bacterium]
MRILLFSVALITLAPSAEKVRNVVVIIADDYGVKDMNLDGSNAFYETPNLAKFAKTAVNFTNGYSSCPVCSPTRSAMLSGQSPARTHNTDYFGAPNEFFEEIPRDYDPVRDFINSNKKKNDREKYPLLPAPYLGHLPKGTVTLADALKKHGYATLFAGKWHLGPEGYFPEDHGFDINIAGNQGGGPYTGKKYFSPYGNPKIKDGPDGEYLTERLGRDTANFIKANKDKPFFAYLSFYAVHTPLMAPVDLVKKYEAKREKLGLKDSFSPESPRQNRTTQSHAVYAAMIESMDSAIGHVLDTLEAQGLADNTLVIFTSDNGGLSTSEGSPTSNLPYRAGKGWLYEGGIRVPVIVRHPKAGCGGSNCAEPIYTTDYFPTILAATGLDLLPDAHKDGNSFLKYLENPAAQASARKMFWHYPHWGNQGGSPGSAIRDGKWKLIRWAWPARNELFDLEVDPGESNDLSAKQPELVDRLSKEINFFLKNTQARSFTQNPNFKGSFKKW